MHVEVPTVTARELLGALELPGIRNLSIPLGDDSAAIRQRVVGARAIQQRRPVDRPRVRANADMGLAELNAFCRLDLESTSGRLGRPPGDDD